MSYFTIWILTIKCHFECGSYRFFCSSPYLNPIDEENKIKQHRNSKGGLPKASKNIKMCQTKLTC